MGTSREAPPAGVKQPVALPLARMPVAADPTPHVVGSAARAVAVEALPVNPVAAIF